MGGQKIPAALKKGGSKNAAKRVKKAKKAKLRPKPHFPKVKPGTIAAKQVKMLKYERKHPAEAAAKRAALRKTAGGGKKAPKGAGPKPHYPRVKPGTIAAKQVQKLEYERKHPKEASAARAKLRKEAGGGKRKGPSVAEKQAAKRKGKQAAKLKNKRNKALKKTNKAHKSALKAKLKGKKLKGKKSGKKKKGSKKGKSSGGKKGKMKSGRKKQSKKKRGKSKGKRL